MCCSDHCWYHQTLVHLSRKAAHVLFKLDHDKVCCGGEQFSRIGISRCIILKQDLCCSACELVNQLFLSFSYLVHKIDFLSNALFACRNRCSLRAAVMDISRPSAGNGYAGGWYVFLSRSPPERGGANRNSQWS